MSQIKDITQGHYKELMKTGEDLYQTRMAICKTCPLFTDTMFGMICDSKRYLNAKTNKTSYVPLEGYKRGCGCRLSAKTRLEKAHCP